MSELFPQSAEKLARWRFSGEFGTNFSAIFDLQMWCIGCDIRRAAGNLLVDYGFERCRPEQGEFGSSHYSKELGADCAIHLWGFAIVLNNPECGICLKRHQQIPLFTKTPKISERLWRPQALPKFSEPRAASDRAQARSLLYRCASELSKYEAMVEVVEGSRYRSRCLQGHRKRKKLRGISLKEAWGDFQNQIHDFDGPIFFDRRSGVKSSETDGSYLEMRN